MVFQCFYNSTNNTNLARIQPNCYKKLALCTQRTLVKEALEIDAENEAAGIDVPKWWDAIMTEMKNVRIAFEEYEGNVEDLIGYQKVKCHIIFDVKLGENFRRKARLVAGGHTTDPPSSITYSSVVSRDSVRIALTLAALNDLDVLGCDIQNAYISAPCREKIYCIAGQEFGSDATVLPASTSASLSPLGAASPEPSRTYRRSSCELSTKGRNLEDTM